MTDKAVYRPDHFSQLQWEVIDPGLCNRCGTCIAVCPEDCIEMPWPNLIPALVPGRDCTSCGLCIKVCPGKEVHYDELSLKLFGRPPRYEDEYFGACQFYYLGHAADPVIWRRAAGGGIVSALAAWLLESGEVDGVILCGMSEDEPWKTVGKLVRTGEGVLENASTRYCIVPTNVVLREIREAKGKYALVGAGCHISGFRKMADVDTDREWDKRVALTIGIMCGGNVMPSATLHLIQQEMGIEDLRQIKEFRHRGIGGTGAKSILKNGEKVQLRQHFGFQHQRMLLYYKAEGCRFCMDNVNELADLTVGDHDNRGEGIFCVRSERGAILVQRAIEAGVLEAKEIDYVTTLKSGATFAYMKAIGASKEKVEELEAVIPKERTLGNRGNQRLSALLKERQRKELPVTSYGGREQFLRDLWGKRKVSRLTRLVWWAMKQPLLVSLAKGLPPAMQFGLQKLNMGYRLGEAFHGAGEVAQRRIKILGWEQFVEEAEKSRSSP